MSFRNLFHGGTFLLLIATVLLLVSTISSPVIHDISFLKVTLTNTTSRRNSSVTFGALGYCVLDVATADGSDQDDCSSKAIGYDIAGIISATTGIKYDSSALKDVTRALILHPITTGVAFFALLIAASSNCIGFLFASLIAAVAWVITLVMLVIDVSLFGAAKRHVNNANTGVKAEFGVAMWLTLAAFVVLFFAAITTCFSCCLDRRSRRRSKV